MKQIVIIMAATCVAGCGVDGTPKGDKRMGSGLTSLAASDSPNRVNLPDAADVSAKEKSRMVARAALDLEEVLSKAPVPLPPAPVPTASALVATDPAARELDPGVLMAAESAWARQAPKKVEAAGIVAPVLPQPPAADPLVELAGRMAGLLAGPESGRIPDAVALAAIEGVRPGVLADLESPTNTLGSSLSPMDRAALLAARERVLASPSATNDALVKSLARMSPPAALRIARSALCRRVEGFGRFDAIGNDTFIAGKPIRAIVYVELDGFTSRPARDGDPAQSGLDVADQVSVDLAQSLTLYHDPSGLQAWHRPAQRVVETSRATRRDFYLTNQVELPGTLTVGRYRMKVTVTDKTTGASDEVTMPVNVVVR